jgi:hypothetical protein
MFTTLLSGLSFGAPWVLLALVALPVLWWLLRVTPPMPRRVVFPPLRLLLGLKDTKETPARTPLWLLLMRLLAAALVIFALAEPLLGRPPELKGSGPLVLFVDNGWPAAQGWDSRAALIADLVRAAAHQGRPVAIEATADPSPLSLLDAGEAGRTARALVPEPWQPSRHAAANAIRRAHFSAQPDIIWLSDGIEDGNGRSTADALAATGHLAIYGDAPGKGPIALLPPGNDANGFSLSLLRGDASGPRDGEVSALGARDEVLANAHFHFEDAKNRATARIALPLEVRNETVRLAVQNEDSAGTVQLLDEGVARRAVGVVSARSAENEQPLLSDTYYLERALTPYADLKKGTISELLGKDISVLVLADIGRITGSDYTAVAQFVNKGGLLIRFAGGRMTADVDDLVPVKLRTGGRYLGGALAWAEPQRMAPFGNASPFNGLPISPDVTVSRQVLAEPSVELADRSWARLQDGTPLVTAARHGNGWIVLFHITASPAWSTLPMSGLYVGMLRRLLALSAGARPTEMANATSMPALETLDGFGHARKPPAEVLPIRASDIAKMAPSRTHPPGIYGAEGAGLAFNAVPSDTVLVPLDNLGRSVQPYTGTSVIALEAPLLAIATVLLLIDAILSLWLRGHLDAVRRVLPRAAAALFVVVLAMHAGSARADDSFDLKAALDTRLAYVVTGLSDVDDMSKAGLEGLGLALKERTSYEPQEPMGVDIEHDDLSFFPLLYWPMDPREKDLSPQALSKIADYMRNGGTIVFDTRDLTLGSVTGANSPGEQTLRRLISKLDLPPLQQVPSDHVLTKAFYLLQDFPGRWDGGKVWVEALPPPDPNAGPAPARGGDGVSPVIIGGNDWAAAWAVDQQGRPLVDVVPGGERQRELAVRFGINLVMYAFTGNYKTDQVHVPALLQRLSK